jgi:hypothetical protein
MLKMPKTRFIGDKLEQQPYFFVIKNLEDILSLLKKLIQTNKDFFRTREDPSNVLKKLAYSIMRILNQVTHSSYVELEEMVKSELGEETFDPVEKQML